MMVRFSVAEVTEPVSGKRVFVSKDMLPLPDPFLNSFGWPGVRTFFDPDCSQMQCHLCGESFEHVGMHLRSKKHLMTAREYKRRFGLTRAAGLVGLRQKAKLILRAVNRSMKNNNPRLPKSSGSRKGIVTSPESDNRRHYCDNQLASRYHTLVRSLERIPTDKELVAAGLSGIRKSRPELLKRLRGEGMQLGYSPGKKPHSFSDEEAALIFIKLSTKLGRAPNGTEMARSLSVSLTCVRDRFRQLGWFPLLTLTKGRPNHGGYRSKREIM